MRVGERWKDADEIAVGDVVRPLGQHDWFTVTNVWVEGDTVHVTARTHATKETARLPILAPKERVEVDPQA